MDTDQELLEALRRGQEAAWKEIFHRLYPCVFTAARHPSAALTPSEAEDVAIEILAQLTGKVLQVRKLEELKALAVTMAARRAVSVQRKKYAEKRGGNQTISLDQLQEECGDHFAPFALQMESLSPADLTELSQLLEEALAGVDDLTRELIHDYLLHGMPYKEMADKHRISISAVGVALYRGLKKIQAQLLKSPRLLKELRMFLR